MVSDTGRAASFCQTEAINTVMLVPTLEHMYLPESREQLREAECTLPSKTCRTLCPGRVFAFHKQLGIIRAAGHPDSVAGADGSDLCPARRAACRQEAPRV